MKKFSKIKNIRITTIQRAGKSNFDLTYFNNPIQKESLKAFEV